MTISVKIGCVANLFSRMIHFEKAGDCELTHTHSFDHLTLLANGSVKCIVDGQETVFKAPHMIYIHKDKYHEFTALEDNTVAYCIHPMRIGERIEDIVDPTMIPNGSIVPHDLFPWWGPPENYNGENKITIERPSTEGYDPINTTTYV